LRPGVRRLLDAMTAAPAYVWNSRLDVLAANPLGRALFAPLFDSPYLPVNQARFLFRDPAARAFFPEWEEMTHDAVAVIFVGVGFRAGAPEVDPAEVHAILTERVFPAQAEVTTIAGWPGR
jgi:hypothetical protein